MKGEGFHVHVKRGDTVKKGDLLVTFDREAIAAAGYSAITPVLVTNHKKFESVDLVASGEVTGGAELLKITAKS